MLDIQEVRVRLSRPARNRHLNCCAPLHAHFIAVVGVRFSGIHRIRARRLRRHGAIASGSGNGSPSAAAPAQESLIPVLNIAPAKGWPPGGKPVPGAGLTVTAFATGLEHPRWLYVLPNGDVLVAETNAPPKPQDGKGIRGWVQKRP